MSMRVAKRKSEQTTPEMVYRVLRAGALTTRQVCERLGMSDHGAEKWLRTLPGIHQGKIGNRKNIWSLE